MRAPSCTFGLRTHGRQAPAEDMRALLDIKCARLGGTNSSVQRRVLRDACSCACFALSALLGTLSQTRAFGVFVSADYSIFLVATLRSRYLIDARHKSNRMCT